MAPLTRRSSAPIRSKARMSRPGLTASAASPDSSVGSKLTRLDEHWQREALRLYREVGECWNPAQYYSRALERIRFYPAFRSDRGQPEEVTSGPLLDLFRRIKTPSGAPGDLSGLAGVYGRLHFLIGDGYLLISEEEGQEVWEYVSPVELRINPTRQNGGRPEYRRYRVSGIVPETLFEAPDTMFEPVGDQVRVFRLWRPSPEYTGMADSPIRPVLRLYRLLERLTAAATAEASSRAAQRGAWFVPEELSFGPVDPSLAEDPKEDPLLSQLQEAMAHAIQNPDSAEAMAPFVVRGPGVTQTAGGAIPTHQLVAWIAMGPQDRYPERQMWDAVVGRIAGSIDMPKELLTGVGDVSHWGQWFLDDSGFRQHTAPTLIRFCNDMASSYLRPAAIRKGIPNADQVTIWFDPSQAVNHPDETGVARDAHDRLAISDEYYREKIGAPDSAAPDEEELARRVQIQLKQFPSDLQPAPQTGATPPTAGGRGGDVQQGPPPQRSAPRDTGRPPSPQGPSMAQMIAGAAFLQLDWTRERAGNRLLRRAQSCDPCKELVNGVPAMLVSSVLGRDLVLNVLDGHGSEQDLVEGTAERFARRARAFGVDEGWSEQLGRMVEEHALRTLYETEVPAFPPGFQAACRRAVA